MDFRLSLDLDFNLEVVFFYDFTYLQCNLKLIIGSFMYIFQGRNMVYPGPIDLYFLYDFWLVTLISFT